MTKKFYEERERVIFEARSQRDQEPLIVAWNKCERAANLSARIIRFFVFTMIERGSSSSKRIDDPLVVRSRIRSACTGCNCAKVTIGFLSSGGMPRRRRILSAPTGVPSIRVGQFERGQRRDLQGVPPLSTCLLPVIDNRKKNNYVS